MWKCGTCGTSRRICAACGEGRVRGARWIVGVALLGALALSGLATRRAVPPTAGADSPALSALLVALGGSRGVLAEVLWWRIGDLQRQNRYAELVPLTDLLVTLEPSSPDVWAYNAWNLAYNISVMHQDPAERWRWVRRGVELLARALRHAPTSRTLLRQMGWFYEDKLGGDNDAAAAHYRAHLGELGVPEDAEAFAARVGFRPDWSLPRTHALYWYLRSGHALDTLRAATALLRQTGDPALIPFFVTAARAALPDLAPAQARQQRDFARGLLRAFPGNPHLEAFLKEPLP